MLDRVPLWSARRPAPGLVPREPTTWAPAACRCGRRCSTRWRSGPACAPRGRCGCSRACARSATCSTRSASTTASTATGERVEALAAEVTNTPWGERHVVRVSPGCDGHFAKRFHVSPFLGMDADYRLRASLARRAPSGARGEPARRSAPSSTPPSRWSAASSRPGPLLPLPAPVAARGGRHLRAGGPPEAEGRALPPSPGAMIARATASAVLRRMRAGRLEVVEGGAGTRSVPADAR